MEPKDSQFPFLTSKENAEVKSSGNIHPGLTPAQRTSIATGAARDAYTEAKSTKHAIDSDDYRGDSGKAWKTSNKADSKEQKSNIRAAQTFGHAYLNTSVDELEKQAKAGNPTEVSGAAISKARAGLRYNEGSELADNNSPEYASDNVDNLTSRAKKVAKKIKNLKRWK